MRVVKVNPTNPEPSAIQEAAAILLRGGLVAFPTETVYGLGANALDANAVARIFAAKGRPSFNPLIVHVPDEAGARALVREWPEHASLLAEEFWPGPVTLVLYKREIVPDIVTAGGDSVALRVPSHPVALALLRVSALPLAAPSANRSTSLSPTTARHVEQSLGDRVDLIVDGGPAEVGIESTVIDLRGPQAIILRPGVIGPRELEPLVGPLGVRGETRGEAPRPAPGMLERHYAPRATLVLFACEDAARVVAEANALTSRGRNVGMVVLDDSPATGRVARLPRDVNRYAQRLYTTLHELDDAGCEVVYVERVPEGSAWDGVRDRLERAAKAQD